MPSGIYERDGGAIGHEEVDTSIATTSRTMFGWPSRVLLFVVVLLLLWLFRHRLPFDTGAFARQLRSISPLDCALGVLAIYGSVGLRATRWSILLSPRRKTTAGELQAPQWIGFTAVAIFGRAADLTRPYLIAKRTGTPVATQLAVYSIERAFDLAAAAILFSVTLAFAPTHMPHHEGFVRAGILSFAATAFLASFAFLIRFAGDRLAILTERLLKPLSVRLAAVLATRLREARDGFQSLTSFGQLLSALGVSLVIWLGISIGYLESARCFRASPQLSTMNFTGIMLLLATSLGGSLLQLPVIGWFTQIAVIAAAYRGFYGVPVETATACGALTLVVTLLSVIPVGAIASRFRGIPLSEGRSRLT